MKSKSVVEIKMAVPAPPPPPLPRFWVRGSSSSSSTESVTNREIAKFWRQKRIEEEEHLLAAIKAAARIRARNFTEEDYRRFKESLEDENTAEEKKKASSMTQDASKQGQTNCEVRVGIKDWWTKSKYAYLNEPAVDAPKKNASTYVPNCFTYKPTPLYPTSVF